LDIKLNTSVTLVTFGTLDCAVYYGLRWCVTVLVGLVMGKVFMCPLQSEMQCHVWR